MAAGKKMATGNGAQRRDRINRSVIRSLHFVTLPAAIHLSSAIHLPAAIHNKSYAGL